ncbi:hypothetical protein SPHINGO391_220025 [Sphingomonas aurantiaca]|uniref:Uncharacterized protein n=1 Tax=Sphingomonas aurantiaca TaxID=185949 RepID=A0A5E7XVU4_9SPHN|nr:hypothetical protein SPHINGO391_220025 [Sphingomonas aurantiaca]
MQPEHALAGRRVSGPIFPYSNCRTTVPELILKRAGFVSRIRFTQNRAIRDARNSGSCL